MSRRLVGPDGPFEDVELEEGDVREIEKDEDEDEEWNEDEIDEWDDDEEEDDAEGPSDAPWTPVPVGKAVKFLKDHPDATLEVVFPTVYEEDRAAKIQDLSQAQALKIITHRRMSEQIAKELGFEEYDYDEEMDQIEKESPPGGGMAGGLPGMGAEMPGGFGADSGMEMGMGLDDILGGEEPLPLGGEDQVEPEPKRAELSGEETARFRRLQRQSEAKPPFVSALKEAFSALDVQTATVAKLLADLEEIKAQWASRSDLFPLLSKTMLQEISERITRLERLMESHRPAEPHAPDVNVHIETHPGEPPKVSVEPPSVNVKVEPPSVNVNVESPKANPAKEVRIPVRGPDGLIEKVIVEREEFAGP